MYINMLAAASETVSQAGSIALFGMLGIFGVLGIIMAVVALLNRVTSGKDK